MTTWQRNGKALWALFPARDTVYDICRPQTADCRPQIADYKLKDTKNLPNKGDTIKNINRVKVRKQPGNRDIFLHWPHCQDILFIDSPGISLIAMIFYSFLIIVN